MKSNAVLWVIQVLFGIYFVVVGVMHFVVPEGLPGPMEWMYDLSDTLHVISGTAEILGGLGGISEGEIESVDASEASPSAEPQPVAQRKRDQRRPKSKGRF